MTVTTSNRHTKQQKEARYRPSLTSSQIQHLVKLAKLSLVSSDLEHTALDNANLSVLSTLAPFAAKIETAALVPAYKPAPARAPKPSQLESLGGTAGGPSSYETSHDTGSLSPDSLVAREAEQEEAPIEAATKEEYWEACYHKTLSTPTACTLTEIEAAREHKYLNDLMTPAELEAFEAEMFANASPDACSAHTPES